MGFGVKCACGQVYDRKCKYVATKRDFCIVTTDKHRSIHDMHLAILDSIYLPHIDIITLSIEG